MEAGGLIAHRDPNVVIKKLRRKAEEMKITNQKLGERNLELERKNETPQG